MNNPIEERVKQLEIQQFEILREHSKVLDGINQTIHKIVGMLATQQTDILTVKAKQETQEYLLRQILAKLP